MKITLINPPVTVEQIYGKYSGLAAFQQPIGLCALASYLIKYGYKEVKIVDASALKLGISNIVKDLLDDNPDLLGIYCNTPDYYVVSKLASEVKRVKKSLKIVVGGPHPSFLAEDILNEAEIDYCVLGEGEETLLELVRHIDSNSDGLNKIDGLAYRAADNQIIINKPRKPIQDLDNLPFPAVCLLPAPSVYKPYLLQYKKLPYMAISTFRGCPFDCIFCQTPFGKTIRYHSPNYVVDYIEYLVKQLGIKELHFSDSTFTLDEKRAFEICDLIRKRNLKISWYANTRANIKDKGIFSEMKKAGCWITAIGVESADPQILQLIKKKINLDDVKSTCALILSAGLMLKPFFILGNPGETLETIERTIRFAASLKAHYPVFSLMTPYPGSELWDTAEKYGTFDRTNYQKLLLSGSDPVFIPNGLTKEVLLQKQKEAFRRVYCNLGMFRRQCSFITGINDVKKLSKAVLAFIKVQST